MYNIDDEINELDLLIESTKEEFNDYAESLLNEYAFDEVKPLLESAHFEAELIITEAEDEQVNKIKEAGEEAKDKVSEKFNSPVYTKKCKEIEEAIKEDPSVGEQLVEVPAVDKICKEIISSAKKGEELDKAILSQSETITLKQLMLKRKRIQTIIGVTIGVVATAGVAHAGKVINDKLKDKLNDKLYNRYVKFVNKSEDIMDKNRSKIHEAFDRYCEAERFSEEANKYSIEFDKRSKVDDKLRADSYKGADIYRNAVKNVGIGGVAAVTAVTLLIALATSLYGVIMGVKIHKIKKDIKNDRLIQSTNELKTMEESYFDSLFD